MVSNELKMLIKDLSFVHLLFQESLTNIRSSLSCFSTFSYILFSSVLIFNSCALYTTTQTKTNLESLFKVANYSPPDRERKTK